MASRSELVNERPSTRLVAVADSVGAHMIVVGSYTEAPLEGAIIGSTAHKLLTSRSGPC